MDQVNNPGDPKSRRHIQRKIPEVNLTDLTPEQQSVVNEMLYEERDAFSIDDDIGCITDVKMEINLPEKQPIQKNYTSILCPLNLEVKCYLEDLQNKNLPKVKLTLFT